MATIHFEFDKNDVADSVIMPGDPLRAKYIAENYLQDFKQINSTRNMLGYTGFYKGKKVSIIGSGMGIPSMGIYSYELFKFYNVKNIIRVGTCGAYSPNLTLFDVVLVDKTYSDSKYGYNLCKNRKKLIASSNILTNKIEETAKNIGINIKKGNNHTSEVFTPYIENYNPSKIIKKYKCITSEMEAYSLFINAELLGRNAACILTVSDTQFDKKVISKEEREKKLTEAVILALESILSI